MIEFFESLISDWNDEEKCGLCWNFYGAARSDYSNLINHGANCCVAVILLDFGSRYGYTRNQFDINHQLYLQERDFSVFCTGGMIPENFVYQLYSRI